MPTLETSSLQRWHLVGAQGQGLNFQLIRTDAIYVPKPGVLVFGFFVLLMSTRNIYSPNKASAAEGFLLSLYTIAFVDQDLPSPPVYLGYLRVPKPNCQ